MENIKIDEQIINTLKVLPKPLIIAISGFGGSGKSSFSKSLGTSIDAPVIGVDSFQKDGAFDTQYKLWEIMDFARLEKEVLLPFLNKEEFIRYGHFNPKPNAISETIELKNNGKLIIEGVGLFRPELLKYFNYKIWIDCSIEEAITRGKKRDREEYQSPTDEFWDNIWKQNDLEYIQTFNPKSIADLIISNN